jgi:Ca2+-binding RTX toxin-like protein
MIHMSRSVSIFSVVVVMTITVLATVVVAFAQEDPLEEPENEGGGGPVGKVSVCHNTEHNPHIITVGEPAVAAHLAHGDSTEGDCGGVPLAPGTPEPPDGTTLELTTLATTDVTLGSPISDTATLSGGDNLTGSITFKLYGPFTSEDPSTDQCIDSGDGANLVTTLGPVDIGDADESGNYVVSSDDPAVTTDDFVPTDAGRYQWVASYSGDDANEPVTSECNAPSEQSVVDEASTTTGTEQNMTLAGEIGEAANSTDPATDTTNIEGTTQNGSITLGTDSENDVLYGNASANKLLGGHGNDYLDGGKGRDRMVGGKQADRINGADGKPGDVINGGIGIDYCVGDVGDEIKNCDGNVVNVPLPSEAAAPAEARS